MEGPSTAGAGTSAAPPTAPLDQQQQKPVERLNAAVQQQLNIESVKTRAFGLYKAIARILEDFDIIRRTNNNPKWQDVMSQFSMVNMELYNIVEDVKKVSKAFVVHPKFVTAENAQILPVMLSSKLLPEMEVEDNSKRDQLLQGMQHLPVTAQIERLKGRIDMIGAACESAEKIIADMRKAYGLGTRQGPTVVPTLDKVQAAKIQEQESLLRAAVNSGKGLQVSGELKQHPSALPRHLADVLNLGDNEASGMFQKNTPPLSSNNASQGSGLQTPQLNGRSIPSPSGTTGATSFDNTTTSPLPYANSPKSGTNIMNAPSPQQQHLEQQRQIQQQQHRQKMLQQQQLPGQSFRQQPSTQGLGQGQLSQLHEIQSQAQKFQTVQQMQYSQALGHQQFQNRQLQPGHGQINLGPNQLAQGNLRNHLTQFAGTGNSALYNSAQSSSQMIHNVSSGMAPQSHMPRMQFALPGGLTQRNHTSQILNEQMFSMGATNPGSMMSVQQQQPQALGGQGSFGNMSSNSNMAANSQNLQSGLVGMPNASQMSNFQQQQQQQRQQNQQ